MAIYGEENTVNRKWYVDLTASGSAASNEVRIVAVLQDIRAELQQLNALLSCRNFTEIPATLREIRKNTTTRPYTRKAKP